MNYMELYYLSLDADFESNDEMELVEKQYNLSIVSVTKFEIQLCKSRGEDYCGPNVYLFIGKWTDIVNYLVNGYTMNDVDELQETLHYIQPIKI